MLYISRYIGTYNFGVVDTDDGVEQEISQSELESAINVSRLDIVGSRRIAGFTNRHTASPWQDPSTLTPIQTKTHMMCGVDVLIYKNMITKVVWRPMSVKGGVVKVRLSQFGNRLTSKCFYDNSAFCEGQTILILDNKLSYDEEAFRQPVGAGVAYDNRYYGVTFDLRELSDSNAILVYRGILKSIRVALLEGAVIDTDERTARVQAGGYDYVYG